MADRTPDFIVKQEDAVTILSKLRGVIAAGPFSGCEVEIYSNVRSTVTFTLADDWESRLQKIVAELQSHRGMDILRWKLRPKDGNRTGIDFHTNRHDLVSDITFITRQDDDVFNVLTAIETNFEFIRRPDAIISALPDELRQRFSAESNATEVMRDQTARMAELLTRYSGEALQRESELRQKLESEFTAKREGLESDFEQRRASILEREEKAVKLESDLKLREHRGVRRETLEKIQASAGLKFSHSPATSGQGRFIHGAVIASFVLSICVFTAVCNVLSSAEPSVSAGDASLWESIHRLPIPVLYAPALTSIILLVSTVIFYLRWLRASHDNLARRDFETDRMQLDMMRASWIAELILEAHNPTGQKDPFNIPESLVTQLSHRLFDNSKSNSSDHPIEDLQRYAKQFKKLTVGPVTLESLPRSDGEKSRLDSDK
jgi:hypothetical protein